MTPEIREAIARAVEVVGKTPSLAITCHVSPDGDAIGSALALAHAARGAGVEAVVSFGEPFVLGPAYGFLDTTPLVLPSEFPTEPEVMVVFDVASVDRLGELGAVAARAGTVVIVDHHASNSGFGDVQVIDPDMAASAQLATYLIEALGWEIDETIATCLLTGIVTDTGRFQYSATDGETLRVAARLLDAGARPEVIGQHVYESVPAGYLALSARVLGRAVLEEERRFIWSTVYLDDLVASGVRYEETDPLIDDLRVAREADVAALLKQVDGGFKVSLRSRGRVDVGRIASEAGGGGHHNAAGFTGSADVDEVLAVIRAGLT